MSANQQLLLGEGAGGGPVTYIEDVFSTYLYTGTGASQTITNNIDLSTKGGLTWIKSRSAATGHRLTDTVRGATKSLVSETTAAEVTESTGLTAFGTTGFTIGADSDYNTSADTYASWTFRKQAKFFDIVTYTGTGANRTVAHNLGSVPGCIIVKRTDTTANWAVYHRSLANTQYIQLNKFSPVSTGATYWNSTTPTSSVFSLGTDTDVNDSGGTYVAYIYAHDAGGFGLSGTDNVISCGSFVGASATVTLGYEPQWILTKNINTGSANWRIADVMRGMSVGTGLVALSPNTTDAESTYSGQLSPTATGFNASTWNAGDSYIYIAIRRGPMKVPDSGTSVYNAFSRIGTAADATVTGVGFPPDWILSNLRALECYGALFDRLRGGEKQLRTNQTAAESTQSASITSLGQDGYTVGIDNVTNSTNGNTSSPGYINYFFRRAPIFFDEVCYTGTGANTTQTHNLGVVPELMIVKGRSGTTAWQVYSSGLANTEYLVLNTTAAKATGATRWNSTTPTSSVFSLGTASEVNTSAATYVTYLFATCAGVSKVGSYTGNGDRKSVV